jgi:prevent-host-death family protein
MTQVTIHQAKTNLSRLIQKALQGEEVVIAKRDQPLVRLVVVSAKPSKRVMGCIQKKLWMASDFDDPLPELEEYTYTEVELAQRGRAKKRAQ